MTADTHKKTFSIIVVPFTSSMHAIATHVQAMYIEAIIVNIYM